MTFKTIKKKNLRKKCIFKIKTQRTSVMDIMTNNVTIPIILYIEMRIWKKCGRNAFYKVLPGNKMLRGPPKADYDYIKRHIFVYN